MCCFYLLIPYILTLPSPQVSKGYIILPCAEVSPLAEAVAAEGLVGPIYEAVSMRSLRGRELELALKASVLLAELATTSSGERISVTENEEELAEAGATGFKSEAWSEMASSLIAPLMK